MHGKKNSNSTKRSLESKSPFKNKILSEKGKKPNEVYSITQFKQIKKPHPHNRLDFIGYYF